MLTNEMMGAFCLGVVWLNTALIVAHVWQAQGALAKLLRELGPLTEAKVVDTGGAASLAELRVAQTGRAITTPGPDRILCTEASRASHLSAGVVEIGGERVRVEAGEGPRVWAFAGDRVRRETDFDAAFSAASTSRGVSSDLVAAVGAPGQRVWLAGSRDGDALVARLVSDVDPRALVRAGRARAFGFVVLALAVLGGITALALVRPWFSGLSTLGGMLAVAYFLSVQPLAVALREAIAVPEQRRIGGIWARPS